MNCSNSKPKNVLFVTTVLPSYKSTGGELASSAFVESMGDIGTPVDILGYTREDKTITPQKNEYSIDSRVIETGNSKLKSLCWLLISLLRNRPISEVKYDGYKARRLLKRMTQSQKYDIVVIDHAQSFWAYRAMEKYGTEQKIIFIAHNSESNIYSELAVKSNNILLRAVCRRESRLIKKIEAELAEKCSLTICLTSEDRKYFTGTLNVSGGKVTKVDIPSSISTSCWSHVKTTLPSKQFDVALIGTWSWKPNMDGLIWFLDNVLPLLPGTVTLTIAGRGAERYRGAYKNIEVVGFVEDAQIFMAQSRIVAIPAVSGSGIQIKTLDAISSGASIVATTTAVRGIENLPAAVLVEDDPRIFAKKIMALLLTPNSPHLSGVEWGRHRKCQFNNDINKILSSKYLAAL